MNAFFSDQSNNALVLFVMNMNEIEHTIDDFDDDSDVRYRKPSSSTTTRFVKGIKDEKHDVSGDFGGVGGKVKGPIQFSKLN